MVSASLLPRPQAGGRLAVRLERTPAAILIFTAALFFSCQRPATEGNHAASSSSHAEGRSTDTVFDPPIAPPQGFGKVRLTIDNSQSLKLSLFRIVGNDLIPVERPIQRANQFEVDSGFYLLRSNDRSVQYPVPAIAPFVPNNRLSVQVEPAPEPKPGWCWIPAGPAIVGDTLGVGREACSANGSEYEYANSPALCAFVDPHSSSTLRESSERNSRGRTLTQSGRRSLKSPNEDAWIFWVRQLNGRFKTCIAPLSPVEC